MSKAFTLKEKQKFYKICLYMLFYYIALLVLSAVTTVLSYYGSRVGGNTAFCRWASIGVSTLSSALVVVFWFVGRIQQDGFEIIMQSKVAWVMNVVVDLFELAYVCLSTVTSLYNGNIIKAEFSVAMPAVAFFLMFLSAFDLVFSAICVVAAKRKLKN